MMTLFGGAISVAYIYRKHSTADEGTTPAAYSSYFAMEESTRI